MVNAAKHKKKSADNDSDSSYEIPDVSDEYLEYVKNFESGHQLVDEIIEIMTERYNKPFNDGDAMNIGLFFMYTILMNSGNDKDKESVKKFFCEIIDDRYKLNETIFEKLAEMYAVNDIAFECYQNKDFTDYHERIEKRTAEYKYKAWNDELKAIKECASNGENRIEKINGGV